MSLDLISSLDTRFFADEISSQHISFDLESSLGSDDHMMTLSELTNDPMVSFHPSFHDTELMDAGMSSDSDCNSYSGLLEFNFHSSTLEKDFSKFDPSNFPNLSGIGDDVKLEPISPLAQSPMENVGSLQILDTPPISPPIQSKSSLLSHHSNNTDIIKVITIDPDGNFHLPNEAKVVLTKNSVSNISPTVHLSNQLGSNIQPKPLSGNPMVIKLVSNSSAIGKQNISGQPLVLTAEEFASLTQQNSGKCAIEAKTSSTQKLVQSINSRSPTNPYSKPIMSCSSPPSGMYDGDVKALKRQQRMIKNRESACLSRKKKKEYVTSLESTLSDLNRENQQLKQENAMLREKLALFEREREGANKSLSFGANAKKTTAFFAVLLMLSFNMAAVGKVFFYQNDMGLSSPEGALNVEPPTVFQRGAGRSLLWANEESPLFETRSENTSLPMCPMLINLTESSRIDSELRGWFHAPATNVNTPILNSVKPDVELPNGAPSKHELAKVIPHSSEMSSTAYRNYLLTQRNSVVRNHHAQILSKNEIQIYEALPDRYLFAAFFEAIERKNDTFYVVSFSSDHLLLPATEHNNNTVRPRMSLLLPAMPLNQTMQPPSGHVAMMQIDCEVTNTRLLHIREDSIPPFTSDGNRTEDRRPDTGKRAWRKNNKKNQQKVGNFNVNPSGDSRG
ncbi:cyclic AMP-dependent transcription factor ATF-6 alpha-like isoform X2 [Daphnia pulicaria]|uniref:cyclic AMP-dependent transcription factor ATF-6 alpha-like isoform X2 n=1 Tax=Daphnia pulicaria TaxID=35523 RepID=UPI001EEBB2CE|nr:cyclic AMP-dependent transcription factor ATF-6 alpha-like isoform X2 [Daphnia pulicaria]